MIPRQDFDDAMKLYRSDQNRGVKQLLDVLFPVISATMDTIHGRGMNLLDKHNRGELAVQDCGNGNIEVQSERGQKTYTVNLIDLECKCPYYQKVKSLYWQDS